MFSFPITKSSLCFTDVKIIAISATIFVNDFRLLRTIQAVLVKKERFDAASVLKLIIFKLTQVEMILGV